VSDYNFEEEEFTSQFNGGTLLRIGKQLLPYKRLALTFLIAVGVVSLLDSVFTYISRLIIDEGILGRDPTRLVELVTTYAALIALQIVCIFIFIYAAGILGEHIRYNLRKQLFAHLQKLSLSYYDRTPVGWMMSRVMSDSERISDLVTWGLLDTVWAILNIVTALIFMATINWQLTILVALIVPILLYVAAWFKQRILVEYRQARKTNSLVTASYNETLNGARVIQALGRQDENLSEFREKTAKLYRSNYRAAWFSALFLPSVQLIAAFAVGGIALYGGWQYTEGSISLGGIQAFITYVTFMIWPIQDMARIYASMQHAIASAERSFSLLDTQPEIVNRKDANDPGSISGDIHFDNVTFYYDENKPVLTDFNLKVKRGEMIALVGATGSGKSTIVNLLCRFYEPKRGAITIGGRDYTSFTLEAIQSRIGVVLQTPHLFSGTIRENIRYGRLNASDEEVVNAAQVAGAHEFITALDGGYDAEVGEGGILLSVGQKQLISLARAVLSDPELLVMDEATSSIDTLTEALIQRGMEHLMNGRTSFVIAHRLSTIKRADRILVIDSGRIIENGTHAELLRLGGHYYDLYTKQFRREMLEDAENDFFGGDALPERAPELVAAPA
jgi:ATP-binding cassette subfamily B protein